jgi:hypothetical protein
LPFSPALLLLMVVLVLVLGMQLLQNHLSLGTELSGGSKQSM